MKRASTSRRAFTLIETVVAVVALSIAIPPTLMLMNDVAGARADAVQVTRATTLAQGVLEHVIADVSSDAPGLGFDALTDPGAYLDGEGAGLHDRIADVTQVYLDAGFSYEVVIGPLVDNEGTQAGDPEADVFRRVSVEVTIPLSDGSETLEVSTMVTAL